MIDLTIGTLKFQLSPYERVPEPDDASYDWIKTFIEYKLPGLSVQYSTEFTVYELKELRGELQSLYEYLLSQKPHADIIFDSLERHFSLHIEQSAHRDIANVNIMMKPEDHADSVKVTDSFCLDQSYFPALLSGLDEMINWQN